MVRMTLTTAMTKERMLHRWWGRWGIKISQDEGIRNQLKGRQHKIKTFITGTIHRSSWLQVLFYFFILFDFYDYIFVWYSMRYVFFLVCVVKWHIRTQTMDGDVTKSKEEYRRLFMEFWFGKYVISVVNIWIFLQQNTLGYRENIIFASLFNFFQEKTEFILSRSGQHIHENNCRGASNSTNFWQSAKMRCIKPHLLKRRILATFGVNRAALHRAAEAT